MGNNPKVTVALRTLNAAIKQRGKTSSELIEAYGFENEDSIRSFIVDNYNDKEADKLLTRLEKNDERGKNKETTLHEPNSQVAEPSETIEVADPAKETLAEKEARLTKEVVDLELEHLDYWRKGIEANREARAIEDKIKALKQKVDEYSGKAMAKQAVAVAYYIKIKKISIDHAMKQAELEKVRSQISDTKKVYVLVGADGTIEAIQNNESFELEFGDWQQATNELFATHNYDNLNGNQLGVLAKLFYARKNCLAGLVVEFAFDKPFADLEQFID